MMPPDTIIATIEAALKTKADINFTVIARFGRGLTVLIDGRRFRLTVEPLPPHPDDYEDCA